MPGSGSNKRQMSAQILVRMPGAMKEIIGELGQALGRERGVHPVTEASVCREILTKHLSSILASRGVEVPKPVKAKKKPRPPRPEYISEIALYREVLGETNGSLRQSINLLKINGRGALADEISEFLPVLKAVAEETTAMQRRLLRDLDQDEAA